MTVELRHLVVIVMENLTYDALFGQLADTVPAAAPLPPAPPVLGRLCLNSHRCALTGVGGPWCRVAVPARVARWYWRLTDDAALFTDFYSAVRGPSLPNQLMLLTGQSPFLADVPVDVIPPLPSLAERLDAGGFTWRNYSGRRDGGFSLLPQLRGRPECRPWTDLLQDAAAGTLPHLAWVTPPFALSEHPPMPWVFGTRFLSQVLAALTASPLWPALAVLVLWDDWGGYWDHMRPPVLERWRDGTPFRVGPRVPLFVLSEWIRPGPTAGFYHGLSVTRLVEDVFHLEPLTARDRTAPSLLPLFGPGRGRRPAVRPEPLPPACLVDPIDRLAGLFDG
jgi:phospholipase C